MKFLKIPAFLCLGAMILNGCSSDSSSDDQQEDFAMTFKMNGVQYNVNNVWGGNFSTTSIFVDWPESDYIRLQGTTPLTSAEMLEINLNIKRTDFVVGTYPVSHDTDWGGGTHADLINNMNDESENTYEGEIKITQINTTAKTIKGTFHFKTADVSDTPSPVMNFDITDGTFSYRYDTDED